MCGAPSNEIKVEPLCGDGCVADAFMNLRVSTSGARMKHNVHGSLLTNAHLCEQTHSATARHEYAAQRNTNDTETANLNLRG